jgi:hypothetical protein
MKYFTLLLLVTTTAAVGCELNGAKARGSDSSAAALPSARVSTLAETPRIIFHIPPLVATADRPRERADTLWSPNDDRDSVQVALTGVSDSAHVSIRVEALIEPQSQGEDPPVRTTRGRRAVTWKTVKNIRLDSLTRLGEGHLLLLLQPSGLKADRTIPMNAGEEVGGIRVNVVLSDGHTTSATLSFLPAI